MVLATCDRWVQKHLNILIVPRYCSLLVQKLTPGLSLGVVDMDFFFFLGYILWIFFWAHEEPLMVEGENINTWFLSFFCIWAVYLTLVLLIRYICPSVVWMLGMWGTLSAAVTTKSGLHNCRASGDPMVSYSSVCAVSLTFWYSAAGATVSMPAFALKLGATF